MFVPEYLKDYPHLPLKPGTTSQEATKLCNEFYGTSYKETDFMNTQAFVNQDGCLVLELTTNEGETIIIFKNKAIGEFGKDNAHISLSDFSFENPINSSVAFMVPAVKLIDLVEVDFLKYVVQGEEQDIFTGNQELFYQLATLLNRHEVMGRWSAGSMNSLTTSGFTLVYYGEAVNVPKEFIVPPDSKTVIIIKINHGDRKGHLCLSS